jgi:beta-lactamase regulating signal transducer with metallopeptidase domain
MSINILIYLIEASLIASIFYLFYRYLYFKLAYFAWSRYYMYAILVLSIIIPLLPGIFNYETNETGIFQLFNPAKHGSVNGLIKVDGLNFGEKRVFPENIPYLKIILIIWISGIIRHLFILTRNLFSIRKLVKTGNISMDKKYRIVENQAVKNVFSFFNFIFINKGFISLAPNEQAQILKHEKIHARLLHSVDNLIFEIYRAVFWFNPVSKLITADSKIIHEFITDNILTGNRNKSDYSLLILKLSAGNGAFPAASSFSNEEIKNRIKTISFPEKEKIRKRRFIISIPVLLITIFVSWFIMSSANIYIKPKKAITSTRHKPFDEGKYKIISPYFTNKEHNGLKVSHEECMYEVKNFSNIYAIEDGIISNIKTKDIFGLKEISISEKLATNYTAEYSGLYKIFAATGDSVKKGDIIGKSGDTDLYPVISIKIIKTGKTFDPEKFY